MHNILFDTSFIEEKLTEAKYEPTLGIRLIRLATMHVSGKEIALIVIRLDPGKQLIPHMHEIDGEICFPLSKGIITLGKVIKDKNGSYNINDDGKILVDWDIQQNLIPGQPIQIPPEVAHHLYAPTKEAVTVCFFLPSAHLDVDKKFVTFPKIER